MTTYRGIGGKVMQTPSCSHIYDGTVWPGCSFCAEANQDAYDESKGPEGANR